MSCVQERPLVACRRCRLLFQEHFVNDDGECVMCQEYRKNWLNKDYACAANALEQILTHYRARNQSAKYDVIVAFSGGRDSVYALHLLKNRFGMRPLAVTADNGLLTEKAYRNMDAVLQRLGVDHQLVRRDAAEMQAVHRAYFSTNRDFCAVCSLVTMRTLAQAAEEFDVPLVVTGTAYKLDATYFRAAGRYCLEDGFVRAVKDKLPPAVYQTYLSRRLRASQSIRLIHLFDYIDYVDRDISAVLGAELGWNDSLGADKHADCRFNAMIPYMKSIRDGADSLVLMKPAALLRDGQITPEEFDESQLFQEQAIARIEQSQILDFMEYFGVDEQFLKSPAAGPVPARPMTPEGELASLIHAQTAGTLTEGQMAEMVLGIVDRMLRRDGGGLTLVSFVDNVLTVGFTGGCRGCTIGDQVEMRYIEHLIRTYVSPDIALRRADDLVRGGEQPSDSRPGNLGHTQSQP